MPYNFLLAAFGGTGHLGPMLAAAHQLRSRGHEVRLIGQEDARAIVERAGYRFASWKRTPSFTPVLLDSEPVHQVYNHIVFGPASARGADLRDEIGRAPTDVLLADVFLVSAGSAAEAAGIPCALLSTTVSPRPLPGVPPLRSGLRPPKTPEERAAVDAASARYLAVMNEWLPMLNRARETLDLTAFDTILELFDRPERLLLAISAAFDFSTDRLPKNVRYIGPLLDGSDWAESWIAPWPHGAGRVRALVSFSTTHQSQRDALQRTVDAMAAVDMDGIATVGPTLQPADLQARRNVIIVSSAPHDAVMKEVSFVVTHGGHGTVSRALWRGLPLLIMPMGRDQNDIASRVENHSAGLVLPPTASETQIAAAMMRLVSEPHFRLAAHRLGVSIANEVEARRLIEEMEELAGTHRSQR
jgi:MGT family glycosyltransferase